ncbi:MAG: TetR/AcrR family transcriptional regulator [Planctomycetota bacterium]
MTASGDEAAKRVAIREAARELFRRYGVKKTSMREIAEHAGVAVGTLYLYYPGKDELVLAAVEGFRAEHDEAVREALASTAPAGEKLRTYLLHRFRASKATRLGTPFAREVTEAVLRVAPDRLREEGATMLQTIRRLLDEGARRGELGLEDAERDARVLLHAVAAAFPTALSPVAREPEEGDLLELVDWFLRRWRERAEAR